MSFDICQALTDAVVNAQKVMEEFKSKPMLVKERLAKMTTPQLFELMQPQRNNDQVRKVEYIIQKIMPEIETLAQHQNFILEISAKLMEVSSVSLITSFHTVRGEQAETACVDFNGIAKFIENIITERSLVDGMGGMKM